MRAALEEDRASDDITTLSIVPAELRGIARLVAREDCVIAGMSLFDACFVAVDGSCVTRGFDDGARITAGQVVATVTGPMRALLQAERTALNFVQRLSGVATITARFVARAGTVELRDTRKTTPGLRALEKAAVRAGGGTNHRPDLASAILIKDNHIAAAGGIGPAIERARAAMAWIECECDTLEQVREAVDAGADEILLDNMSVQTLRAAVELVAGRARTEASGGVTLDTVAETATTGVDAISVGALTHSARAIDLSLEVEAA